MSSLAELQIVPRSAAFKIMGFSRSSGLVRESQDPDWPTPLQLSPRKVGYRLVDVQRWIETRQRAIRDRQLTQAADAGKIRKRSVTPPR